MPPVKTLTLEKRIWWQKKIIRHDRWVIKTARTHKPEIVKWHKAQLKWITTELRDSLALLRLRLSSGSASTASFTQSSNGWPKHHLLWLCIHSHEAGDWHDQDTGHNGHYGGLQMHPGWGYGTSYYASNDSQFTQERAAENGYAASGFSTTWLMRQWYHPDCLRFA